MSMVRSWIPVAAVIFCAAVSPPSFAEGARAVLKAPEKLFDFGSVPQGAKVVHEFEIGNQGDAELQIQRITPSCGCTAAVVSSNTVKPGASEKIRVEFDTAGFSGSKTKTVEVLTSDLDNPELVLSLKGVVLPGVTTEPRRLEFGELSAGSSDEAWSRDLMVNLDPKSDLEITNVSAFSKFVTVTPLGREGKQGAYRVQLSKDAPRGELRDRVVIEFAGGRQQPVNVPITASVRGDLRVVPSTLSFGVLDGRQVLERRVKFENIGTTGVSITKLSSSDSAVSASVLPGGAGRKGVIVVRVDPTKVRGDLKATVDIETDDVDEPRLSLNVFAVQPPK